MSSLRQKGLGEWREISRYSATTHRVLNYNIIIIYKKSNETSKTYQQLFGSNGIVRVEDQKVDGKRIGLPKLGADQQASSAQQLKVIFVGRINRQEPVQIVDGQWKNVFLALLLFTNLQKKKKNK